MSMPLLIFSVSPHVLDLDFLLSGSQRKDRVHPGDKKNNESHPVPILYKGGKKCTLQIKMKYARIPWK